MLPLWFGVIGDRHPLAANHDETVHFANGVLLTGQRSEAQPGGRRGVGE